MTGEKGITRLTQDDEGEVHQISISTRTLRRLVGAAAALTLVLVLVAGFALMKGAEALQMTQMERQNAVLASELDSLRERVGALQEEFDALYERDAELRIVAGLDLLDEEVRQVGIGGPGSLELEDHPLHALDESLGEEAFAATYDLSALERRARLLRESLTEAADSLQAHRELLESTPSILPTSGLLTSGFTSARPHPIHNRALPHEGVDISAPRGTAIMAAANGRVSFSGRRSGYGLVVEVDHGYGYSTVYGHASETLVRTGQTVGRGDVIAKVGSTGIATSPHLHYEVRIGGRPVNPMNFIITDAIP